MSNDKNTLLLGVIRKAIEVTLKYPFAPLHEREHCLKVALAAVETMEQGEQTAPGLVSVLREVREALQFANDSSGGGISDTIWMMHRPETLFDFIDTALESVGPSTAQKDGGNNADQA